MRNFNVTAYTVEFFVHCLKKVYTMACYNSDNNKPILTIFGGNVTEKVSSDQAVFSVFFLCLLLKFQATFEYKEAISRSPVSPDSAETLVR